MRENFLKLNDGKTEFILIGSRQQLSKVNVPYITIGDSDIIPAAKARNQGAIFDSTMCLNAHVSNIVRCASFHIRNIGRIRKYLDPKATENIMHSFVTSRLDMGNSLLTGLPENQVGRLQRIQNAAARLVTLTRKRSHNSSLERVALAAMFTESSIKFCLSCLKLSITLLRNTLLNFFNHKTLVVCFAQLTSHCF